MSKDTIKYYNAYSQSLRYAFGGISYFNANQHSGSFPMLTNSRTFDFNANYRYSYSTELVPVEYTQPNPPLLITPTQIYHNHVGQIPNFTGHIPGARFRYGRTFGNDTIDCKRWLRGDYSI